MTVENGGITAVFNGEIYNHPRLKKELEAQGEVYKTRADTETALRLFAREGVNAFARLDGMFAFAAWNPREQELVLARDPVGIKPLYYSFDGKRLLFSSELRSLLAGGIPIELDPAAVVDYLSLGKVHGSRTVIRGILKLPPGHWLRISAEGLKIKPYWRLPERRCESNINAGEMEERLDELLSESVKGAMLSDVPLGAFLSGGVDSSLVAAYMAKHSGARKVQTFCVGFSGAEPGLDESAWARRAAARLGAEHHELILPATVLDRLEDSIGLLDEPIGDSAILPTFLLAKFARETVKVVLTGEGADELFAGYDRYKAAWINEGLKRLPGWGRTLAAPLARRLGKGNVFRGLPYDDARAWAGALSSARLDALFALLSPDFRARAERADPLDWLKDVSELSEMSHLNDALAYDLKTTLADSLLMKVDKSTMRASLEARVPFLNKPVIEFALGLPSSLKIRFFKGKYILRKVAQRHLPKDLVYRRKHGFWVPWEQWVRNGKNNSLNDLLSEKSFADSGVFDIGRLRLFREELVRGSRCVEAGLMFRVAVFGLWLQSLKRAGAPA